MPPAPTARRLDELKGELFRIFPTSDGSVPGPIAAVAKEVEALRRRQDAALPPLSEESRAVLERASPQLALIEDLLLGDDPVQWRREGLGSGPWDPSPGPATALLAARAWQANLAGDEPAAERSLEATWSLLASWDESLLRELMASSRFYPVLRASEPSEVWLARLSDDWAGEVREELQIEAWEIARVAHDGLGVSDIGRLSDGKAPGLGAAVVRFFTAPWVSLSISETSQTYLEMSRELAAQPCGRERADAYAEALPGRLRAWNVIGRIAVAPQAGAAYARREAALWREQTLQVVRARIQRRQSGTWPSGAVASAVCPTTVVWEHLSADDGSLTIRASSQPFPEREPALPRSLRLAPRR